MTWLAVHPDPRPDAPLFCRLDRAAATRLPSGRWAVAAGPAGGPADHAAVALRLAAAIVDALAAL